MVQTCTNADMPYKDPEKQRIAHNAACQRWRERDRKRYLAHQAVKYAVKAGKLVPWPGCAACRRKRNLHAHHCDYDRPLDVVWLCVKCHKKAHAIVGFRNTRSMEEPVCEVAHDCADHTAKTQQHAKASLATVG